MNTLQASHAAPARPPVRVSSQWAAEDLRTLAWLHAGERDALTWLSLHEHGFPRGLSLAEQDEPELQAMEQALSALFTQRQEAPRRTDDRLAADFAGIYLTHAFQASPCESVWLDEDHLMMQAPTFEVREAYRRHGMQVQGWRRMPDDHLSHELAFVAFLLEADEPAAAAEFLDQHLMRWLPGFAARVAQRSRSDVYGALALLTLSCCRNLRRQLQHDDPPCFLG